MLPPLFQDGCRPADWNRQREDFLHIFQEHVYGRRPDLPYTTEGQLLYTKPEAEGRVLREEHRITVRSQGKAFSFALYLVMPRTDHPLSTILLICNRDRDPHSGRPPSEQAIRRLLECAPPAWRGETLVMLQGMAGAQSPVSQPLDLEKDTKQEYWPVEEIVASGHAAAAFYAQEVQPDDRDALPGELAGLFDSTQGERPRDSWGALGIWAFAASCAVDILSRHPSLDPDRIALAGHSRGGKAALWCAAQDPRIGAVLVNNSGCSGAALSRGKRGENVASITAVFPHWFCPRYAEYAWREEEMPFDQHMLLACVAPRLCYVTSATRDLWSDPDAEWRSVRLAAPAWQLSGEDGAGVFCGAPPPAGGSLCEGGLGYHRREGGHDLTLWDWRQFLAFLRAHGF